MQVNDFIRPKQLSASDLEWVARAGEAYRVIRVTVFEKEERDGSLFVVERVELEKVRAKGVEL